MLLSELVVKLGLDSADLQAKGGAAQKKLDDIEKSAAGAESGIKGVGEASKGAAGELVGLTGKLGAFLALIGGTYALEKFARDAIQTNTQLGLLAKNIGVSAQSIFSLGVASEELGGTSGGLQGVLKMISQEGSNLAFLGESRLIPFFARMRIALPNPRDPNGPVVALREMARYAENAMKLGANRTTMHNWFAEFIPDEGTINLILQGTAALDAAQVRAKKWAPSPSEIAGAMAMKSALADLSAQFMKVGYDILQAATPAIETFLGILQRLGAWIDGHATLSAWILGIGVALAGIAAAATTLGIILPALEAAFAVLSGPIGLVVAAIAALGSGFLLLLGDYKTWEKGGISEFDWSGLADRVRLVGNAFEWVGDRIERATGSFLKWLKSHGISVGTIAENVFRGSAIGEIASTLSDVLGIHMNAPEQVQRLGEGIATAEGFYNQGGAPNIPQRTNNPGDIEYGPFAQRHGATGFETASGGKKIAVFPNVATGMKALYALLQGSYGGMTMQQALAKYTGLSGADLASYSAQASRTSGLSLSSMLPGKGSSSDVAALIGFMNSAHGAGGSSPGSVTTQNKNIHIAQMHVHTQATDAKGLFESLKRATDFLTWGAPANSSSQ